MYIYLDKSYLLQVLAPSVAKLLNVEVESLAIEQCKDNLDTFRVEINNDNPSAIKFLKERKTKQELSQCK